ncbi:MAG TPA: DNA polymerase IV [Pirellulales bacterium]|nr:DNA polymerase IV [Pirellulales bacterium]
MILHVDMDAFYASVEERERPELVGKPLIVGGTPEGRGVVAAANYAVRKFGVHSAMPAATALRLCPQAIVLRPRMDFYARVSEQIREIFDRYTPLVEPLSLDEAFLDVSGSEGLFGSAAEIGRKIKQEIQTELRLTASVGVAPNKFLAKIASDFDKPDGFVVVDAARVQEFLDPLPVGRLWGVGRVAGQALERMGVRTIRDLRLLSVELLERQFGQAGQQLWQLAHGVDQRRVVPDREAKSISHETTFATDLEDMETLRAWIVELAEQVGWRLRRHKLRGRTVQIKVRFDDFQTVTRAQTLAAPTNVTQEICAAATAMLAERLPKRRLRVRLLGVGVSHFENPEQIQGSLFADEERQRQSRLDEAADQVKLRFGSGALQRGSGLLRDGKHKKEDGRR